MTASSTELLCRTIFALQREFTMTDLRPLHHFLGIIVERRPTGLFLHQRTYTLDILKRTVMADCKPCTTPVDIQAKLAGDLGPPIEDASVSEHCRSSPVPDIHMARHRLRRAADLSAHARPSGAPSDSNEAHPALSSGDTRLRSSSTSFEQL
jgi:hypothetical protein